MTTIKRLADVYVTMTLEDKLNVVNELANTGMINVASGVYEMGMFNHAMSGFSALDVAAMVLRSGHFNPDDAYFRVDELGVPVSMDRGDASAHLDAFAEDAGSAVADGRLNGVPGPLVQAMREIEDEARAQLEAEEQADGFGTPW